MPLHPHQTPSTNGKLNINMRGKLSKYSHLHVLSLQMQSLSADSLIEIKIFHEGLFHHTPKNTQVYTNQLIIGERRGVKEDKVRKDGKNESTLQAQRRWVRQICESHHRASGQGTLPSSMSHTATLMVSWRIHSLQFLLSPGCRS